MASAAGQLRHQPGTCCNGASPASPEEGEQQQQLHLKMCKKIAQLTKVIYALNLKNDEHEATIQALKEAHQEEIQHILAETREAALHYKRKVEKEQELRQRIQTLEEALEHCRPLKEKSLGGFTTLGHQEDQKAPLTESEHAVEEISLPTDTLHMKPDSENRVRTSNQESDSLLNEPGPFEGEKRNNKGDLNEKGNVEMWTLIRETEALKRENQKLVEEYAEKACQLRASHERDKETWRKATQQALADSGQEWQQREREQRARFEARDAASQQQVRKLEADLETKGQRLSELKKHSQKLKETMQDLEQQLMEARHVTTESKRAMKTLEEELTTAKERLLMQENEILQKTEAMEKVLDSQSQGRDEVGDLKSRILHFQQVSSSKRSPGGKDPQEAQAQFEELKKKHEDEIRQLQREKDAMRGKLQDRSQEVLRLEDFIRQNRDIAKYAEFLKHLARKPSERQQESQGASAQPKNVSKQHKGRTKCREQSAATSCTKSEEKRRSNSGSALKREVEPSLASSQKENAKEMQPLQEEWASQKAELQAQVAQLKQTLEEQASGFQGALYEQKRQSGAEKEKLLQKLEDVVKQSQDVKAQLEASHQTALNLLEESKNQELKEAEEHWKKESTESCKAQEESCRQEEKAREALQSELEKRWQQQSLLIDSLRTELAEQRASCILHKKEKDELQEELRSVTVLKKQQEEKNQDQVESLKDEVVKCQAEICGLKKENALLKETLDLLRADAALQKQTSGELQEPEGQHRRFKELEETPRKKEPRPEDLRLISCLQEKLNEKEEMIKELMDGRNLQPPFESSTGPPRNRSFSFNTNPSTCLAPIAKQKKKMDDMPSRIVSVPNLASYAKSFLSGDLRPKRNPPQITKSTSLDPSPGCVRVCYPPVQVLETKPGPRLQSNETANPKDAQKLDPRPQEWFTKYFSF
ncbi:protein FAM184B [Heteronotia binoei]|uniref:protein FAM184B n=1 Tax=Heteronotia binoei TaxID=13085 RepID=UPI002930D118|nr:protein FAM184B [Heteronotia binoei]